MAMKIIRPFMLACLVWASSPGMMNAAEVEGALVLAVSPAVTSTLDGTRTTLAVKMNIPVTSVLTSNADGWAQLMFPDASTISISPDTELELAEFVNTSTEQSVVMNLASGTARVITGDVARRNPSAIVINTPQASVGVRGTIACIKAGPEKTIVYLTETSGAGIIVTDRVTGATVSMTTAGNVLEVQPGGNMQERPATPAEARANTVAARGPSPEPASTAQASANPASESAAEAVAQPTIAEAPGNSQTVPINPGTPTVLPPLNPPVTPPDLPPVTPQPPVLDVNNINGTFSARGTTRAATPWAAGFSVAGTQISGASLTLNGRGFATNGTGTVASDAKFTIGNFASADANDWGKSTSMNGKFNSVSGGSLNITNTQAGLNASANFGMGMNVDAIGGRFGSNMVLVGNSIISAGFTVVGSSISDAVVFSDKMGSTQYHYADGRGTVASDGSFTIGGFTTAADDPLTLSGKFNSLTNASLNIKTDSNSWNFNTNLSSLITSQIGGVFEVKATSSGTDYTASFQVDANAISNAALYRSDVSISKNGSGTIAPDATFNINGFSASSASGNETFMSGYFASLNGGIINIKNANSRYNLDVTTTFFGLKPANISGSFSGSLFNNTAVAFDVANSSLSNVTIQYGSNSATGGTGSVNANATFQADSFQHDGFGNTVLTGAFTSPTNGSLKVASDTLNDKGIFNK